MSGAVDQIRRPAIQSPEPEAPALGFSMQVDLGAGRVATLQTFLPNDCSPELLDRMLDKMTRAGDRQRAHYKIEELQAALEQEERQQAQHLEDLNRNIEDYEARQAKRKLEIEKAQKAVDTIEERARDAHVASGRRGEFKLSGNVVSQHTAVKNGIANLVAEGERDMAERDTTVANSEKTFERRQSIIQKLKGDIVRCKAITGEA